MTGVKEQFRQEVIQSIHVEYPGWQAEPKDEFAISVEVSGQNGRMNLDNLYSQGALQSCRGYAAFVNGVPKALLVRTCQCFDL